MNQTITSDEFNKRLVQLLSGSGLSGLPRRSRDRHILLKSVTLTLDRTREYSEREINQELRSWLNNVGNTTGLDHVELRRRLIDQEYLGRGIDGSRYWVAVSSRRQMVFDREVEDVNIHLLMKQGQETIREKKRKYLEISPERRTKAVQSPSPSQ